MLSAASSGVVSPQDFGWWRLTRAPARRDRGHCKPRTLLDELPALMGDGTRSSSAQELFLLRGPNELLLYRFFVSKQLLDTRAALDALEMS
jgi:hypothetical protein